MLLCVDTPGATSRLLSLLTVMKWVPMLYFRKSSEPALLLDPRILSDCPWMLNHFSVSTEQSPSSSASALSPICRERNLTVTCWQTPRTLTHTPLKSWPLRKTLSVSKQPPGRLRSPGNHSAAVLPLSLSCRVQKGGRHADLVLCVITLCALLRVTETPALEETGGVELRKQLS